MSEAIPSVLHHALDVSAPSCHTFACGRRGERLWIVGRFYYCGQCMIDRLEHEYTVEREVADARLEQTIDLAVRLEQALAWRIPTWQREGEQIGARIDAIGYVLTDGEAAR